MRYKKVGRKPHLILHYKDVYGKNEQTGNFEIIGKEPIYLKKGEPYCSNRDFEKHGPIINVQLDTCLDDIDIIGDCLYCGGILGYRSAGWNTIQLNPRSSQDKDYIDWALSQGKYEKTK